MTRSHEELQEALGAYALGQLAGDLHADLTEHLTTCGECREELEGFRLLASALRQVDPGAVVPVVAAPPPGLDERVNAALAAAQKPAEPASLDAHRGRRWPVAAVGFLVGVAATTVVALVVPKDDPAPIAQPTVVTVKGVETARGVSATVGFVAHTWGVELKLKADGLPGGEEYAVRLISKDGKDHDAGEFLGVPDTTINCNLSSPVLRADAKSFMVVDPQGKEVIWGDLTS